MREMGIARRRARSWPAFARARESAIMPLDESLSVMVAMDAVRRQ